MNCHPQLSAGVHSCQQSNAYICRYVCTVIPWLKIAFSQQISHSKIAISWECSADSMRPKCCPSPVLNKWRAILLVARVWKLWLMYPKSFQRFKIHKIKTHKNLVLYSDDLSQGFDLVRVLVCVCVCVCVGMHFVHTSWSTVTWCSSRGCKTNKDKDVHHILVRKKKVIAPYSQINGSAMDYEQLLVNIEIVT